jgi:uncharacterized protein YkwD
VLAFTLLAAPPATAAPTRKEMKILRKINNVRANYGRGKLRIRSTLQSGAHKWAIYLQRHNAFYHGSLASGVTENIAWISCRRGWAREIVRMWLNSPAHRANLLDGSARYFGAGVATGSAFGFKCTHIAVTRFK